MPAYRLTAELNPDAKPVPLVEGTLLFPWRMGGRTPRPADSVELSALPSGDGYHLDVPRDLVEPVTQPRYTEFEPLLRFYLTGAEPFPHLQAGRPSELDEHLNIMAMGYGLQTWGGRVLLPAGTGEPGTHRTTQQCRAFMGSTQGGDWDGSGLLLIYRPSWDNRGSSFRTARFAICDHELVEGRGGNPSRGWRPAHCAKCGLNLSVDSGD